MIWEEESNVRPPILLQCSRRNTKEKAREISNANDTMEPTVTHKEREGSYIARERMCKGGFSFC